MGQTCFVSQQEALVVLVENMKVICTLTQCKHHAGPCCCCKRGREASSRSTAQRHAEGSPKRRERKWSPLAVAGGKEQISCHSKVGRNTLLQSSEAMSIMGMWQLLSLHIWLMKGNHCSHRRLILMHFPSPLRKSHHLWSFASEFKMYFKHVSEPLRTGVSWPRDIFQGPSILRSSHLVFHSEHGLCCSVDGRIYTGTSSCLEIAFCPQTEFQDLVVELFQDMSKMSVLQHNCLFWEPS